MVPYPPEAGRLGAQESWRCGYRRRNNPESSPLQLNIERLFQETRPRSFELYREHIGPMWAKMLRTIGFDRSWVRGEGSYLWDAEGRRYLDFMSGWGLFNFGRGHPAIRRALTGVMEADLPSWAAFDTPPLAAALAEELTRRMPNGLARVYFCNSGAEAVEAVIKFARVATGKPGMVHLKRSFHGLTNGALALHEDPVFRDGFGPFLPGGVEVDVDDYEGLEHAFSAGDVGLFIFEPVQGKGVYIPEDGFLLKAQELCREHGALLVCDEVQTGLGRTGKFLAFEWVEGLDPDIVLISKALSGGYVPVGAMLTRPEIHDSLYTSMGQGVRHACTFGMGDLAMAAGLASLQVLDAEDLAANARRLGGLLGEGVEAMMPRFGFIKEVRQRGLMIGIEFGEPESLGLRTAWTTTHRLHNDLFCQAVVIPLLEDHRILAQVAGHGLDVVKLLPPLNITEADIEWFLEGFRKTMESLHSFPGPAWEVVKRLGKHAVTARRI